MKFRPLPYAALVLFAPAVASQEPPPTSPPPAEAAASAPADPAAALLAKVEQAIADFEAVRKDPKKAAQRNKALLWLGELDHAQVSTFLGKELQRAGDTAFAAVVLQAIGKVARPALLDEMWAVLRRESAPAAVRLTAGQVIAGLGERGIDKLAGLVRSGDDTITPASRDYATTALLQNGGDRGIRELAPLLLAGSQDDRLKLLRQLAAVRGVLPVDNARLRLVREGDLPVAALAWRQLAETGHPKARELTIDMFERLPETPPPAVAADLMVGLCLVHEPDFYPVILRYGAMTAEPIRRALRVAAPLAAKDPDLVAFLARKGLEDPTPAVREVALVLLRDAPKEAVQPLLAKVRAELKNPKKQALELAIGLHELLAKDPTWRADCAMLAAAKDPGVRTVGLSLLLELGDDSGLAHAQQSLTAKLWELRSIAFRYLTRFRDVSSIPLLIARVDREDGRLAAELGQALFVHTGTRCWKRKEWEDWWSAHKAGFALPHPETVKGGVTSGGGRTVSYYDIPLVSARVAFLIDHSGSMTARIGTDRKFTRLEAAKEQMRRVVEALPKTHRVNLVIYDTVIQPIWETLREFGDENRAEMLKQVESLRPGGGTNIFDALEKAFADPEVDTIYLLTDGTPTAGRLTDPDDILDEVKRWNRRRQIVVHCIGLGIDSQLLKDLAAATGGVYKYVR